LVHLCSNVIKFTNEGKITVSAHLLNIEDNQASLAISIKDSGIGISKSDQDKPFIQTNSASDRDYGSTELGLVIASEFIFTLKLDISDKVKRSVTSPLKDISHLKVLVAEDNRINQVLIKSMLAQLGIRPTIVQNGKEAVEVVQQTYFYVTLMDGQMPVLDGYQATEKIRKLPKVKNIPIIAVTADVNLESIAKALDVGFTEHLSIPIDMERLKMHLQAL
jgi:CheY-like chemotaxis protein